tara:strand:- start:1222 stop:1623 length:402 start_codon:yes stop_codon:yes gene_type:complete
MPVPKTKKTKKTAKTSIYKDKKGNITRSVVNKNRSKARSTNTSKNLGIYGQENVKVSKTNDTKRGVGYKKKTIELNVRTGKGNITKTKVNLKKNTTKTKSRTISGNSALRKTQRMVNKTNRKIARTNKRNNKK